MFCQEQTLIATQRFGEVATAVKCRSWGCPNCAPMRKRQLIAMGFSGEPNRFITITCRRGSHPTAYEAAIALAKSWRTVVQRWRRLQKHHRGEYLCVFEATKNGWPHLHILWRGHWISQKWLSDQLRSLIASPVCWVERLASKSLVAGYVVKYCGKDAHKFGTAKRYWSSKGFCLSKPTDAPRVCPKEWKWETRNATLNSIRQEWQRNGRLVYQITNDMIGCGDPWATEYNYNTARPTIIKETFNGLEHWIAEIPSKRKKEALHV